VLDSILRFLVSLDCIQIVQLSKLVLAVSISFRSIFIPLVLSFSSLIALRFICPNLLCASSIVFLLNTIFSLLESILDSILLSRLDSRSRLVFRSLLVFRSKLLSSLLESTRYNRLC
jgi:hypothetical protein